MAGSWSTHKFPRFEAALGRLVAEHRELELEGEQLHLALCYLPADRDQEDIFLFEVIAIPARNTNQEGDLFEVTYSATAGFPMAQHELLHLILTNTRELEIALREGWPLARELVNAIRAGDFKILFQDDIGDQALAMLLAEAHHREVVSG